VQHIDLNNKTILVTGCPGFIGANLVIRLLKEMSGGTVVSLDNMNDYYDVSLKEWRLAQVEKAAEVSQVRHVFIKGSIGDKALVDELFATYHFDIVVNLAAQAGVRYSIDHPDVYIESNIIGFYNLLEACRHNPVEHLVYASSSSVYGGNKKVPFSTDDKVDNPVSLYAATKKSNELLAHAYSKLYNIPSTGLRFFTVYGPAGRPDMFYYSATQKLVAGKTIQIFNYTPDFKTHKSEKNRQNRKQYIQRNHHEAIVDRDVYNAANLLKSSHQYAAKNRPLPTLSVIDGGVLSGYVPVDKNWTGFSTEEYRAACESVDTEKSETSTQGKRLYMGGYEVVRADYFPSNERPAMTITNGKLRFNTACLKKFEDVEYVELLLNTVKNCIAIRPCEKDNPNAIHWGRLREERWVVNTLSCRGLAQTLFDMMSWEDDGQYRFSGEFKEQGDNKLLLFELGEPVITKTVEQIVVPEETEENEDAAEIEREEFVIREKVRVYPPSWATSFGVPVCYLEQHHYSGEWDVLRQAKELEDMNTITADRLAALMKEAETIMEGWTKTA